MSDYKQTRDAAGNVTSQYGQMLRNLDDDLVDRLNDRRVCSPAQNSCRNDHVLNQAEARIEELEANLAKAVEALRVIEDASRFFARDRESSDTETLSYAHETTRRLCSTTLAELKGETDE